MNRSLQGATGADAEPFLPSQSLDLAEALAAYTIGSAYVNHLDDETGSIERGKLADLVVLDRDPFAHPAADIGSTGVLATYVQGEPGLPGDERSTPWNSLSSAAAARWYRGPASG